MSLDAPLQADMQHEVAESLRIAIVGAGVAGPALVALLCRGASSNSQLSIDIFERGSREMDQGGGYDLNNQSRKVLEKAGVMHRYWEMTRPDSNVMSVWIHGQSQRFFALTQPRWAHSCFGPKYETNRTLLREILLEAALEGGRGVSTSVRFDCPVDGLRQQPGCCAVELLGNGDEILGVYDLIIDSSGVGSPLRACRVQGTCDTESIALHETLKNAYTGLCMIHGVILDPEVSCDERFVERLGQGTLSVLGPCGSSFTVQRYGASPSDRRASFYMFIPCPGGAKELAKDIGLASSTSQWHQDEAAMKLIRDYLQTKAFGDGWEVMYYKVISALEFAAIRPIMLHEQAPVFRQNELPLICIGDALHVVPPWTGKGGNLALHDALDVADWILDRQRSRSGLISMEALRRLENRCMTRAAKATADAKEFPDQLQKLRDALKDVQDVRHLTWGHMAEVFCEGSGQKLCCKASVFCCRPFCNSCGCLKC